MRTIVVSHCLHAGGFCLFDSKYTNYTVMQSSYKHDILPDFLASCKKYGSQTSGD